VLEYLDFNLQTADLSYLFTSDPKPLRALLHFMEKIVQYVGWNMPIAS
jgi:hypothetical protein